MPLKMVKEWMDMVDMNKKNKEMKYITVLDFEIGRVFQYKVADYDFSDYEKLLSDYGHNLSNCEWMVHENHEIIEEDKSSWGKI